MLAPRIAVPRLELEPSRESAAALSPSGAGATLKVCYWAVRDIEMTRWRDIHSNARIAKTNGVADR